MTRVFLLGAGLFAGAALVAAEDDDLPRDIPRDAERDEQPVNSMKGQRDTYHYYLPGRPHDDAARVAEDEFESGVFTARRLYAAGKLHEVQRKFHRNGQLAEESSYRYGRMHGRFRQWTEHGMLIADYRMVNGAGTKVVYDRSGFVTEEVELVGNEPQGLSASASWRGILGHCARYSRNADGPSVGRAYEFYEGGAVRKISLPHGPTFHFKEDGSESIPETEWAGDENEHWRTRARFAMEVAADPSLPPYLADPLRYRVQVPEEFRALQRRFRGARPVKIPLELDERGVPLPAVPAPAYDASYLSYSIPKDAVRREIPLEDAARRGFAYELPGVGHADPVRVGVEVVSRGTGTVVERCQFAAGRLHGMQRKWHENGRLAAELPYREGTMHGRFRAWSEQGELIADYLMTEGAGRARVFHPSGSPALDMELSYNGREGLVCQGYPSGRLQSCGWFDFLDRAVGMHCVFHENGQLASATFTRGPSLDFAPDGRCTAVRWKVGERVVTEAEYAAAAADDRALTAYFADPRKYLELVPDDFRALWKRYRLARPVKIPLELDARGEPVLTAEPDYLAYDIPADATKTLVKPTPREQGSGMRDEVRFDTYARYRLPWHGELRRDLVGEEKYLGGVLVERTPLREGQPHGVQHRWHPNGRLAAQSPYRDGTMHGRFRRWAEDGTLIADFQMVNGAGTEVVRDRDGRVVEVIARLRNEPYGLRCTRSMETGLFTCRRSERTYYNRSDGLECVFREDGSLQRIALGDGMTVRFAPDGSPLKAAWWYHDAEVTEAQFAALYARVWYSVPYSPDPLTYKERVPPEFTAAVKTYLLAPR